MDDHANVQAIGFRDATRDDIEQIAEIWRFYVKNTVSNLEETPPTTEYIRRNLENIFTSDFPFIVAVKDTTVCGYAYIGPFNERSGYRPCCEDSIYLHPDHVGHGTGTRMLDLLLRKLKANASIHQVLAKISLDPRAELEEVPSCRLHFAAGFKQAGRLVGVGMKFDKSLDVVILQLDMRDVPGPDASSRREQA